MKAWLMLALFLLAGCASLNQEDDLQGSAPQFQCPSFKEARGVVVDFIQYAPPEEVREDKPFFIGLKFANYFDDVMSVDLSLQDTLDAPNFPDEGVKQTIIVDSAFVDEQTWRQPGCRLSEEEGLTELSLGPYTYSNLDFDDQTSFIGTLKYSAVTEASFPVCAYNPAEGGGSGCPLTQNYNAASLGYRNEKAPLAFTSVEKRLVGSQTGVTLQLFFDIENIGGGTVSGEDIDFVLGGEETSFICYSEHGKASGAQQLRLRLDENDHATVECETTLSLDRVQAFTLTTELAYAYVYPFQSDSLKIMDSQI